MTLKSSQKLSKATKYLLYEQVSDFDKRESKVGVAAHQANSERLDEEARGAALAPCLHQ